MIDVSRAGYCKVGNSFDRYCMKGTEVFKCFLIGLGQGCSSQAARHCEGQVLIPFIFFHFQRLIFFAPRFFSRVAEEKIKAVGGACILTAQ